MHSRILCTCIIKKVSPISRSFMASKQHQLPGTCEIHALFFCPFSFLWSLDASPQNVQCHLLAEKGESEGRVWDVTGILLEYIHGDHFFTKNCDTRSKIGSTFEIRPPLDSPGSPVGAGFHSWEEWLLGAVLLANKPRRHTLRSKPSPSGVTQHCGALS